MRISDWSQTCALPIYTLLSSLDLPSDFLIEVPGIPRLNGGAPRLSPNPDYLRSAEGRDRLREIYGVALGDPVYQPERGFDAKERTFAGRSAERRAGKECVSTF